MAVRLAYFLPRVKPFAPGIRVMGERSVTANEIVQTRAYTAGETAENRFFGSPPHSSVYRSNKFRVYYDI